MQLTKQHPFDAAKINAIAADVLQQAKQRGASQAEVAVSMENGYTVTSRLKAVETLEQHQGQSLDVTVFFGQRTASASSSDLQADAIAAAVTKACNIAKFTQEDDCAGLADKALLAFDYPQLDLYHPWAMPPKKAMDVAIACESKALATDKRLTNSEGVTVSSHENYFIYANSDGFVGGFPTSRHSMSCSLIAKQGDDMQRDYDYTTARDATLLMSIDALAERAAKQTVERLGARSLPTQKVPVIFAARLSAGLLGSFISAISGGNLYRQASFLVDHLHKPVFGAKINIDERPHLAKGMHSAPFDSEGVATKARDIVTDGVLQSYVLSSYSARKLNLQTTGNAGGVNNVFISTDDIDLTGLLKKMGTGLLVTELIGHGINIVTGDYSRGAFGFWVENGEIQYPVQQITIAGNLKEMFLNVVAVANDVDSRHNIQSGSILLEQMTVAGQ